ncbi:ANM_collapsed_G0047470.mRNA.1.CDS.1 [Saccharomyces cerevisiae]|nr:ANM_collapsed_G0047470.mRNA.1.CDS.1 [Saccharomyces cerevisiae]
MTHYAMSSIDKIQLSNPSKQLGQNSQDEKLSQQESQNFTNYEPKTLIYKISIPVKWFQQKYHKFGSFE